MRGASVTSPTTLAFLLPARHESGRVSDDPPATAQEVQSRERWQALEQHFEKVWIEG
jgi:hypothetical protein